MFELFKVLLGTLSKLLDPVALTQLTRERRKEMLGANLFMLCIVVDDICIDGQTLVDELERYVQTMARYLQSDKDRWALAGLNGSSAIVNSVARQVDNLSR